MKPARRTDDDLIKSAWAFVMCLLDQGYSLRNVKKAFSGRMIDAYRAVDDTRTLAEKLPTVDSAKQRKA